jgi:hypothetical protein
VDCDAAFRLQNQDIAELGGDRHDAGSILKRTWFCAKEDSAIGDDRRGMVEIATYGRLLPT